MAKKYDLTGMKAIAYYAKRSQPTVLDWILHQGFPARKIGGIWEASRADIDEWYENGEVAPAKNGKKGPGRPRKT